MRKQISCLLAISLCAVAACSSDETTSASDTKPAPVESSTKTTQNNPLMGYKSALDTAKSVTSAASESEKQKQQAIEDAY